MLLHYKDSTQKRSKLFKEEEKERENITLFSDTKTKEGKGKYLLNTLNSPLGGPGAAAVLRTIGELMPSLVQSAEDVGATLPPQCGTFKFMWRTDISPITSLTS